MDSELELHVRRLAEAIRTGDIVAAQGALGPLDEWLGRHKVRQDGIVLSLPALNRAGKVLSRVGTESGPRALAVLEAMASHERADVRAMSSYGVAGVGNAAPDSIAPVVRMLAADSNWAVREVIANALDDIMGTVQGDALFRMMEELVEDPDANLRRLPTNALMRYGRAHPERVIALMDRLRHDESDYVRKNVSFCLGVMGHVRHPMLGVPNASNPGRLFAQLREWTGDEHPGSRWIIAETLARSWTKGFEAQAAAVLALLEADERPMVARAVARARRALLGREARGGQRSE